MEKQYFASIHGIYTSGRFPNQLYIFLRCLTEVAAKSLQLCPTLGNPIDNSPPGSCPWDSPGNNTGVGCHFLLQCTKSENELAQSCPTLHDPMDCSLPGSSAHGIFQARVLEWGAIVFSTVLTLDNSVTPSSETVPLFLSSSKVLFPA